MTKSPEAFRTISEVAEWLDRPAHVLRFWESKFTQVKPIKRAGGRRYFRPEDMLLLGGIKKLLHDDGLTIKGVQKILREQGTEYVSTLSQPLDEQSTAGELVPSPEKVAALKAQKEPAESATLLTFPRGQTPAEAELSGASYEEAAKELEPAGSDDLRDEVGAPEGPPTAAAPKEDTPSFFSMFESEEAAPVEDTIPEAEDALETADTPAPAEDTHTPETPEPSLRPSIVDVPVDAQSEAQPGILTRFFAARAALAAVDRTQLTSLRDQVADLRQLIANKAENG